MIRPDIQAGAKKWIDELRLQDRIITVRYTRNLTDPTGAPVYGLMTVQNLDEGRFLIEIQDPETWPAGGSRALSDAAIEEVYVHELVHIRWIDLTIHSPDPAAIVMEERATWATARALVRANSQQRAMMIRAMTAQPAAMRRQTKGTAMDAQAVIAALKEADGEAALKILADYVAEQLGGAGAPSAPEPPMNQEAGAIKDPEKDTMPMGYDPKAMKAERDNVRALRAELEECLAIVRPNAKAEIVREMKAAGINVTPFAEKQIMDAPTISEAKTFSAGMRAMASTGQTRQQARAMGTGHAEVAGLTRSQAAMYRAKAEKNQTLADAYRDECVKANKKVGAS